MNKNDWIGWGASLVLHALLFLSFVYLVSSPEPVTAGFIEVDFGPLSQGQPVQQTEEPILEAEPSPESPTETTQPETAQEKDAKPVDLPDQPAPVADPEKVNTPDTETIQPEPKKEPETTVATESQSETKEKAGGGQPEGTQGANTGQDGAGQEEVKAAPFVLEGLDRTQIRAPLPRYDDKVNAVIQMRITVDPRGRIVRIVPLRKGNARLEQSVMQALRRWQFNALAPNVPQDNQTGTVTFTFRLQ